MTLSPKPVKMQALTCYQPYASAIATGLMKVEYRNWYPVAAPQESTVTTRAATGIIAIHAGTKLARASHLHFTQEHWDQLASKGINGDNMPYSAIVALAYIHPIMPTASLEVELALSPHRQNPSIDPDNIWLEKAHGAYAWIIKDVARLREPIPATGRQGLWSYEFHWTNDTWNAYIALKTRAMPRFAMPMNTYRPSYLLPNPKTEN